MACIRILSDEIINQIAAGEIIESPASVIKELVENSIDAGSTKINIFLQNAGRVKLIVEDNGSGISQDDLPLAVQRHATSKLTEANLFDIGSYGFRGEALPSIASISQFCIESNGKAIHIDFGGEPSLLASPIVTGTRVSVQNMLDRLPARLKFLKSDNVELSRCLSLIENFAITHPSIEFTVNDTSRTLLSFTEVDQKSRIEKIVGKDLLLRSMYLEEADDIISLHGYFGHPVDSRYFQSSYGTLYSQHSQRIFVNDRWVKDRIVSSAIKTAFKDLLPAGRLVTCVLFIKINPFYLDINVSPTKSEIRFRDVNYVQKFIIQAIKKNLPQFDRISLNIDNSKLTSSLRTPVNQPIMNSKVRYINQSVNPSYTSVKHDNSEYELSDVNSSSKIQPCVNSWLPKRTLPETDQLPTKQLSTEQLSTEQLPTEQLSTNNALINQLLTNQSQPDKSKTELLSEQRLDINFDEQKSFWGKPIGQLLDTYIICTTDDELVIIDQHAVHEKITMEKMLKNINMKNSQHLTRPEILDLTASQMLTAQETLLQLKQCGFTIELTANSMLVSAIPSVMNHSDVRQFLYDIVADANIINELEVKDTIRLKIANIACHNSIRSGRKLTIDEMKSVISEMDRTESIHQCNHHRPCFVKINKKQLENIFERS